MSTDAGQGPTVEQYLAERYWPEDDLLRDLVADTAERSRTIQVGAEGGQLLAVLLTAIDARRVLEVGALFGYSGTWIARHLPPDGHLDTIEADDVHADAAEHWFARAGVADRVTVHRGRGLDVLPTLAGPYDLAFVDANKDDYLAYAELALERLRPGGVLVLDNMLQRGAVVAASDDRNVTAIRATHDLIVGRDDLVATTLQIRDGITVAVKRR